MRRACPGCAPEQAPCACVELEDTADERSTRSLLAERAPPTSTACPVSEVLSDRLFRQAWWRQHRRCATATVHRRATGDIDLPVGPALRIELPAQQRRLFHYYPGSNISSDLLHRQPTCT